MASDNKKFINYFDDWAKTMGEHWDESFRTAAINVDGSAHAARKIAQQLLQSEEPPPNFISELARLIMLENHRLQNNHRRERDNDR